MRRVDGTAHFNTERFRPDRKRILQMFKTVTRDGEQASRRLYRRMCVLSPTQRILLRSLGLIERVSLQYEPFKFFDRKQIEARR